MSVVLPEPEKPTIATNSPSSTDSDTSLSTSVGDDADPYDLVTDLSSRTAMAGLVSGLRYR